MASGFGRAFVGAACLLACSAGLAQSLTPAAAQSAPVATPAAPSTEPSLEAKERARSAYTRGQASFAQGDFSQALAAFEAAFDAVPNPIVLLSVAESAVKLGQVERAITALDDYLRLSPAAPDRADIEQKRAVLAQTPAHLTITSEPPGADILVDAQPTGKKTPADFDVSPGTHQLQAALDGYQAEPETLQAAPGAKLSRAVVLTTNTPPPTPAEIAAAEVPAPAAPLAPLPRPTATLWLTGSIGAAGIIAGTVLGVLALKERSDFDANPTEARADRGERLALFADVGFGVGAMALVTTVVLLVTHDSPQPRDTDGKDKEAEPAKAQLEVTPQLTRNGASATAKLRF